VGVKLLRLLIHLHGRKHQYKLKKCMHVTRTYTYWQKNDNFIHMLGTYPM
jgi:hypothetical protein